MQLLLSANKWSIPEINEDKIVSELMTKIDPKSCWFFREVAIDAKLIALASHVKNWIQLNFSSIVASEYYLDFKALDVSGTIYKFIFLVI